MILTPKGIPVSAVRRLADKFQYDQAIVVARRERRHGREWVVAWGRSPRDRVRANLLASWLRRHAPALVDEMHDEGDRREHLNPAPPAPPPPAPPREPRPPREFRLTRAKNEIAGERLRLWLTEDDPAGG